jgi:hypothetical protein
VDCEHLVGGLPLINWVEGLKVRGKGEDLHSNRDRDLGWFG